MPDGKCILRVCSLTNKLLAYSPSIELQACLVEQRKRGTVGDTLLIVQHSPVFTIGKRGSAKDFHTEIEELHKAGFEIHAVPRGGETTYHGPGQLVAYPIVDLRQRRFGARAFVEGLEDAMIHTAGCFGIQACGRVPGKTGVWVGDRKIGAVGVRITHGISSHGIALNVVTNLNHYKHIVPCGTPDKEVTSLHQELTRTARPMESHALALAACSSRSDKWAAGLPQGQQDEQAAMGLLAVAEQHLICSIARAFGYSQLQPVNEAQLLVERVLMNHRTWRHPRFEVN